MPVAGGLSLPAVTHLAEPWEPGEALSAAVGQGLAGVAWGSVLSMSARGEMQATSVSGRSCALVPSQLSVTCPAAPIIPHSTSLQKQTTSTPARPFSLLTSMPAQSLCRRAGAGVPARLPVTSSRALLKGAGGAASSPEHSCTF